MISNTGNSKSLSSIISLLNDKGLSYLYVPSLRTALDSESAADLAFALIQFKDNETDVSRNWNTIETKTWLDLFKWKPGLDLALATYMDAQHIKKMSNAFLASAQTNGMLGLKLSQVQIKAYIATYGAHIIAEMDLSILKTFNFKYLVNAIVARPMSEINSITESDWVRINAIIPSLRDSILKSPNDQLLQEAKLLPADFQTQLKNLLADPNLSFYAKSQITFSQLLQGSYIGTTRENGKKLIALIDKYWEPNISLFVSHYSGIITFYRHVLNRDALAGYNFEQAELVKNKSLLMKGLSLLQDTVTTTGQISTLSDMKNYLTKIKLSLTDKIDGSKSIGETLTDINTEILKIQSTTLDKTTGAQYDPRFIQYLMDFAPQIGMGNNPIPRVGISFNGSATPLSFMDTLMIHEKNLLVEADTIVNKCKAGLLAFAKGKIFSDIKETFSQFILSALAPIVSQSVGYMNTISSYLYHASLNTVNTNIANIVTDTKNAFNAISDAVSQSLETKKLFGINNPWDLSKTFYYKLKTITSIFDSVFSKDYGIANFKKEIDTFQNDFKSLTSNILDTLTQRREQIGYSSRGYYDEPFHPEPIDVSYHDFYGNPGQIHLDLTKFDYQNKGIEIDYDGKIPGFDHAKFLVGYKQYNSHFSSTSVYFYGYNHI